MIQYDDQGNMYRVCIDIQITGQHVRGGPFPQLVYFVLNLPGQESHGIPQLALQGWRRIEFAGLSQQKEVPKT